MIVWGIVGWKNAGKTTLVERLVAELAGRGLTVSTLKRSHHAVGLDRPGTDSHRHRLAGAHEAILVSGGGWALFHAGAEPDLAALIDRLEPVDVVLAEGWKRGAHPRIEVWRPETGVDPMALTDPGIRAVAAPGAVPGLERPVLPLDEAARVADHMLGPG